MCELEDVYHTPCGHWGPQRFIHTPCIRSRATSTGHILPCHDKDINGMSNSPESCSACKRASVISSSLGWGVEMAEPLVPPRGLVVRVGAERWGSVSSVSSVSSEGSLGSIGSLGSAGSLGGERPVIRLKRLSAGKIHWSDGGGKGRGLNWFWFGLGRGRCEGDRFKGAG